MRIYNILYFYVSMFCTGTCHKQPLGEVLHSVEICFVTSLLNYITVRGYQPIIARVTSWRRYHYSDVILSARAYHITSLTIVYSTVYSGADQRKHQSSASLVFFRRIHRWPVNSPQKGPVTQKMFPFDDVIMATCIIRFRYLFHKWFSNMQCGLNPIFGNHMANK